MKTERYLFRLGIITVFLIALSGTVSGAIVYSDIFNYFDDGRVVVYDNISSSVTTIRNANPNAPTINGTPTGSLALKIEEDVIQYDPVSHPNVTPGMDRYVYTISNLNFDSGNIPLAYGLNPGVGVNGVSGFNIVNQYNIPTFGMGTPNDPVSGNPWVVNGFAGSENWEWDIRPNLPDPNGGEGVGSPNGGAPLSMNGFWFEVASGTPHGIVPMWVHSWDQTDTNGDGITDTTTQVNLWNIYVSAPIPEPASFGLIGLITLLGFFVRRFFRTD